MGGMNRKRVTLEPELEEEVALLCPAARKGLARKLRRWARQLEVSAAILEGDAVPKPKLKTPNLPQHKLILN
jgi:hypothetical protein